MLTIDDLFPAMDFGFPLTQQPIADREDQMIDLDDDWTSSLAPQQNTQSLLTPDEPIFQEDDLGLNIGDDFGIEDTAISTQIGRAEETSRPDEPFDGPAIYEEDDLGLTFDDEPMEDPPIADEPMQDIPEPVPGPNIGDDETLQLDERRQRDTESPLSEAASEFLREMDQTATELEVEAVAAQRQRSRKQKPLVADRETVLHNSEIKANAADRSKILRPASFLPRDPVLLALMNMQRNGDFVTNAMNDGRSRNWAPELQGLLSFDVVQRSGQLKRKRDSGIADVSEDEHSEKSPRLEYEDIPAEEIQLEDEGIALGHDYPEPTAAEIEATAMEEPLLGDDGDDNVYIGDGGFDETTMPLVHPADNGPVSVGTKRAVHLLRETFGGTSSQDSPASQTRKSVLLQDLVPEGRTTREDATKMFFEVLVLATKDAIKVEQSDKQIGLPLRIRAKRGLWGSWAEATPSDNVGSQEVPLVA